MTRRVHVWVCLWHTDQAKAAGKADAPAEPAETNATGAPAEPAEMTPAVPAEPAANATGALKAAPRAPLICNLRHFENDVDDKVCACACVFVLAAAPDTWTRHRMDDDHGYNYHCVNHHAQVRASLHDCLSFVRARALALALAFRARSLPCSVCERDVWLVGHQ